MRLLYLKGTFIGIVLFLSLGQIGRIGLYNNQAHVYIHELLIVLFCFLGLLYLSFNDIKKVFNTGLVSWWLIFIGWLCISLLFKFTSYTFNQNIIGFMYVGRLIMMGVFSIILHLLIKQKIIHKKDLSKVIWLFIYITIITSFVQYIWYPNLRNLYYLGWDPHWYRVFGLFFDTSVTALVLGFIIFYAIEQIKRVTLKYTRFLCVLSLVFCLVLFFLTYSRIGYISLGLAVIFYLMRSHKYVLTVLLLIIGALVILFLPRPQGESVRLERLFSVESRIQDIRKGIDLWKKYPMVGVGYNRIRFNKDYVGNPNSASGFSSTYVTILASSGLIGMLSFFFALIKSGLLLRNNKITFSMFLLVSIAGLFDNIMFQTHIFCLIVILCIFILD